MGVGVPSRAEVSLSIWSKLGFSTYETSFYPCSNSNLVGPSQRWNRQGPNRRPNRMVISGLRKQKATFGVTVAGFVIPSDALAVRQQSCAPGIVCSVWSYHLPPGWGLKDIVMHIFLSRNQDSVWRLYQPLIVSGFVSPPFPDYQLFDSKLWNSGKVKEAEQSLYATDKKWRTQNRSVLQSPTESCSVLILGN